MSDRLSEELNRAGDGVLCPGVFVVRDGRFLTACRHYSRTKPGCPDLWTIPGGRTEVGETVGEAVLREAAEETGLTDVIITGYIGEVTGHTPTDSVPLFVGTTSQEPRWMEPEKFSEWQWLRPEEIPGEFINPAALEILSSWLEEAGR